MKERCIAHSCVIIPAFRCSPENKMITSQNNLSPARNHIAFSNEMSYEAERGEEGGGNNMCCIVNWFDSKK